MCGIVAYMGAAEAHTVMLAGLARLEYRGYDSAGLAVMQESAANAGAAAEKPGGGASREGSSSAAGATSPDTRSPRTAKPASTLKVVKAAGKVSNLANACKGEAPRGTLGIAHTRWATHGPPTDVNAHPHTSSDGTLAVVHNGIVENFRALRTEMLRKGYELRSDTDTELIAHLIADVRKQQWMPLEEAVRQALTQVEGAFGLAVVSSEEPDLLIGARKGSPLILGIGDDEYLLASDAAAVIERTRRVAYLNDGELVVISRQPGGFASYEIKTLDNVRLCREVQQLEMTLQVTGGRCRHHHRPRHHHHHHHLTSSGCHCQHHHRPLHHHHRPLHHPRHHHHHTTTTTHLLLLLPPSAGGAEGRVQALHAQGDLRAGDGHRAILRNSAQFCDTPPPSHAQPEVLENAMRGRLNLDAADVNLGGLTPVMERLKAAPRIIIVACGTSWHAGLLGEYLIEQVTRTSLPHPPSSPYPQI